MTHEGQPGGEFTAVPETVSTWAFSLMDGREDVYGFGREITDLNAVTVLVGTDTDLSDKELFPDEVDGTPIIYMPGPAPELH